MTAAFALAMSLVLVAGLGVCALALVQTAQMQQATLDLLASHLRSQDSHLSRAHGSLGMALTDAAAKTATAIGQAVQTALAPAPASATTPRDVAYEVARAAVATDTLPPEPDDLDVDPTDAYISPERQETAFVPAADRNPTGLPGFAFDLPEWPDGLDIPTPDSNGA